MHSCLSWPFTNAIVSSPALPHHHPRDGRVCSARADETHGGDLFAGHRANLNTALTTRHTLTLKAEMDL